MSKKNNSYGQIRIIGGDLRGKKIIVLDKLGIRPTTDRARETLFNWLSPIIRNSYCLDCFAGSGALGLEALSRGANKVIFLEKNYIINIQLRKNLHSIPTSQISIFNIDAINWLPCNSDKFDIVFIDPPFYQNIIDIILNLLEYHKCLSDKSWVYIEIETNGPNLNIPTNWYLYRKKITSKVTYLLYIRQSILYDNIDYSTN